MQQSALAHTRFFPISCHDCNLSSRHICPMKGWDVIVTHSRPHICLPLFFHKGVRQYRTGIGQLHKALSYISLPYCLALFFHKWTLSWFIHHPLLDIMIGIVRKSQAQKDTTNVGMWKMIWSNKRISYNGTKQEKGGPSQVRTRWGKLWLLCEWPPPGFLDAFRYQCKNLVRVWQIHEWTNYNMKIHRVFHVHCTS